MRGWFSRLTIRHQLWALFGLFLLTGATELVVDHATQYRARQALLKLHSQPLLSLRHIKTVSDAYGLDVVDTAVRARDDLIGWEQGIATLDAAHRRVHESWAILERLPRTPEGRIEFRVTAQAQADADAAMTELRAILGRKDRAALDRFIDTRMYEAIDPLTRQLGRLAERAMVRADAVMGENLSANRHAAALRVALTLSALTLIALVGRQVLRNAYRGVESLTFLARRMREHDYTAEPPHVPASGELRTVLGAFLKMRDQVLGFETELRQQLERNERTRAELERRELFQRSLLDAAQVAIIALDADHRYSVFNPFAERMLGWRADELIGRVRRLTGTPAPDDAPELITSPNIVRATLAASGPLPHAGPPDWDDVYRLAEEGHLPTEVLMRHKDGHDVPVLMALATLRDEQGRRSGLITVATDLTARKQLEAELRASEARAREASRAKSDFLAAMSHEIRTPMIGVTGMIEVLAHSRLDEDQRHALDVIQQSSQWLLQIIGDILDFSKIEAGRLEITPSVVDLGVVLRDTVASYAGMAAGHDLILTCEVAPRIGRAYHADPLRLRQILGNLLSNAIKFTPSGSVEAALEWLDEEAPSDAQPLGADRLCFRITDTGIGVTAEQQQRLFQPFSQAEDTITRRYGGTGLGLALSARLAELMGGRLTMDSAPSVGTTMRLLLTVPRAPQAELPAPPGPVAVPLRRLPSVAEAERERSLVLLVDDHPTNRAVFARQLALAGYASEAAEDGVAALERWRSGRYALLLSDLHMPRMDGYTLARRIREEEHERGLPRTPLIALTAAVLKGEVERCLEAGMDDYLAKPVTVALLAAVLRRWLPHTAAPVAGPAPPADTRGAATAAPVAPPPTAAPPLDVDPLDVDVLRRLARDEAAAGDLLREFLASTALDLEVLAQSRRDSDWHTLARQAHKIGGAAAMIGAGELARVAAQLEEAARGGDETRIPSLAADVATATERLRGFAAARYGEPGARR